MGKIPTDYVKKVYAGWLGKIIGIRLGAPVETWTYERIQEQYGEVDGYLVDYHDFAGDDDSNGPIFFVRALEDYAGNGKITPEHVGLTLLNYAPYEHGFFWFGGYGNSTEHTAYLNLLHGILPPRSGSVEQNGRTSAEQVGGQIFSDCWGFVCPDDPQLAAEYAQKAACVTHDGDGIYGGRFIAACISAAFSQQDIDEIVEAGLSVIPDDCTYARMARDLIRYHGENPRDWRACFKYIQENYGYDRFPGSCHIIPNAAIVLLSLLYGEGDFSRSVCICTMCGWDTDSNAGNVGSIVGTLAGLTGIEYDRWRKPVNDFLACSSVIGSLNILDIPQCALYMAALGYRLAGEEPAGELHEILGGDIPRFHFELPGSTHGFRVASGAGEPIASRLRQTTACAHSGMGSLEVTAGPDDSGAIRIYHKTYYSPKDFYDSRYDPSFSPVLYPGQTVRGHVLLPAGCGRVAASLYVLDGNSGVETESDAVYLTPDQWTELMLDIPPMEGARMDAAGVKLRLDDEDTAPVTVFLDDFDFEGGPDYTIDFSGEHMEIWHTGRREVSQFTYWKGIWELEDGMLSGRTYDAGEAYTGSHEWTDYTVTATMAPQVGEHHNINFRVQGAVRSYAAGLAPDGRLALYKNNNGYRELCSVAYPWECKRAYTITVEAMGPKIRVSSNGKTLIAYTDRDRPYLTGQIGASLLGGSHCHYTGFHIIGRT